MNSSNHWICIGIFSLLIIWTCIPLIDARRSSHVHLSQSTESEGWSSIIRQMSYTVSSELSDETYTSWETADTNPPSHLTDGILPPSSINSWNNSNWLVWRAQGHRVIQWDMPSSTTFSSEGIVIYVGQWLRTMQLAPYNVGPILLPEYARVDISADGTNWQTIALADSSPVPSNQTDFVVQFMSIPSVPGAPSVIAGRFARLIIQVTSYVALGEVIILGETGIAPGAAWATGQADKPIPPPGYLPSGSEATQGRSRQILFHFGMKDNWNASSFAPYILYSDGNLNPILPPRPFFDSFLFLFDGHSPSGNTFDWDGPPIAKGFANQTDIDWLIERLLREDGPLDALNSAAQEISKQNETVSAENTASFAENKYSLPLVKPGVVIAVPFISPLSFGSLSSRLSVASKYIASIVNAFATDSSRFDYIQLDGFYTYSEEMNYDLVDSIEERSFWLNLKQFVHKIGNDTLKMHMIPWFESPGSADVSFRSVFRPLNEPIAEPLFDIFSVQPNYAENPLIPYTRLTTTARNARYFHWGMELELCDLVDYSRFTRYFDYLKAGIEDGWDSGNAYVSMYNNLALLYTAAISKNATQRAAYDATFQFFEPNMEAQ
jgi:hypothetical protein